MSDYITALGGFRSNIDIGGSTKDVAAYLTVLAVAVQNATSTITDVQRLFSLFIHVTATCFGTSQI
jgi:hypothetical protein